MSINKIKAIKSISGTEGFIKPYDNLVKVSDGTNKINLPKLVGESSQYELKITNVGNYPYNAEIVKLNREGLVSFDLVLPDGSSHSALVNNIKAGLSSLSSLYEFVNLSISNSSGTDSIINYNIKGNFFRNKSELVPGDYNVGPEVMSVIKTRSGYPRISEGSKFHILNYGTSSITLNAPDGSNIDGLNENTELAPNTFTVVTAGPDGWYTMKGNTIPKELSNIIETTNVTGASNSYFQLKTTSETGLSVKTDIGADVNPFVIKVTNANGTISEVINVSSILKKVSIYGEVQASEAFVNKAVADRNYNLADLAEKSYNSLDDKPVVYTKLEANTLLDNKLGKTDVAADSSKLDGKLPASFELVSRKGSADGYAPLDSSKEVPNEHIGEEVYQNAGSVSSTLPIKDNKDGSITISSTKVSIYKNNSNSGKLVQLNAPELANVTLTDLQMNYVKVRYTGSGVGIEYFVNTSNADINESDILPIATILRAGTNLYITPWAGLAKGKVDKIHHRIIDLERFRKSSGLMGSIGTSKELLVTSGIVWLGINRIVMPSLSSIVNPVLMDVHYHDNKDKWLFSGHQSELPIGKNDNNTGAMHQIADDKYTVAWVYRYIGVDKNYATIILTDTEVGSIQLAQAVERNIVLPVYVKEQMAFVGRLITKGDGTYKQIDNVSKESYNISPVVSHNDLADLEGAGVIHLSSEEISNLGQATSHMKSAHAPSDAEKNVQSNWSESDTTDDSFIQNKPDVATKTDLSTAITDFSNGPIVTGKITRPAGGTIGNVLSKDTNGEKWIPAGALGTDGTNFYTNQKKSTGDRIVQIGDNTSTEGTKSVAIGADSSTTNDNSVAINGVSTGMNALSISGEAVEEAIAILGESLAVRSITIGKSSAIGATGIDSIAIGNSSNCNSPSSVAIGNGAKTVGSKPSYVIGKFNTPIEGAFIVGNGTSNAARGNLLHVTEDGLLVLPDTGGVQIGNKLVPVGELPVATVVENVLTSDSVTSALSASQGKWLMDNKINKTDVVDNLRSTSTDTPLSANQGKVMYDIITNSLNVVNRLDSVSTSNPLSAAMGKSLQDSKMPRVGDNTADPEFNSIAAKTIIRNGVELDAQYANINGDVTKPFSASKFTGKHESGSVAGSTLSPDGFTQTVNSVSFSENKVLLEDKYLSITDVVGFEETANKALSASKGKWLNDNKANSSDVVTKTEHKRDIDNLEADKAEKNGSQVNDFLTKRFDSYSENGRRFLTMFGGNTLTAYDLDIDDYIDLKLNSAGTILASPNGRFTTDTLRIIDKIEHSNGSTLIDPSQDEHIRYHTKGNVGNHSFKHQDGSAAVVSAKYIEAFAPVSSTDVSLPIIVDSKNEIRIHSKYYNKYGRGVDFLLRDPSNVFQTPVRVNYGGIDVLKLETFGSKVKLWESDDNGYVDVSNSTGNRVIRLDGSNGAVYANNHLLNSDKRLKECITPISFDEIEKVESVNYKMISDKTHTLRNGYIAQQVQETHPHLVHGDKKGMLSVDYIGIHTEKIARLESEAENFRKEIKSLRVLVKELLMKGNK